MARTNPYLYGPIVSGDSFFGRNAELRRILSRIVHAQEPASCSVVGETRIGKSSLINRFIETAEKMRPDLLILKYDVGASFQTGRTLDFYRQFVGLIYTDLGRLAGLDHESGLKAMDPASSWPVMVGNTRAFFRSIKDAGRWLVIVLDEFDYMTEHFRFEPQGWKLLRSLGYEPDYRVSYLTVSRRSIETLEKDAGISSNFAGIFGDPIRLSLMTDEEAKQLVMYPAARAGRPWSGDHGDLASQVAGPHPYCLQMTCFHLFEWREQGLLPDDVTQEWVLDRLQSGFRNLFDLMRDRLEKSGLFDVLLKIAHGVPSSVHAHHIEELLDLGYIVQCAGETDRYRPFSPALDYYLQAYGRRMELWPLMEETELALRNLVETKYRSRFGDDWLDMIARKNPGRQAQGNESNTLGMVDSWKYNRDREQRNPFAVSTSETSLLEFSYIGDIKQLIDQQWALFQDVFPWRKHELGEKLTVLSHARNPSAHYRRITEIGASKVEICCREILDAVAPHVNLPH